MKDIILNKIAVVLSRLKIYNISSGEAYINLQKTSGINFSDLCTIYQLTDDEIDYILQG